MVWERIYWLGDFVIQYSKTIKTGKIVLGLLFGATFICMRNLVRSVWGHVGISTTVSFAEWLV